MGGNGCLNVHIVGYDGSVHCIQFVQSGSRYSRLQSIARVPGAATALVAVAAWALSSSEGKESSMERPGLSLAKEEEVVHKVCLRGHGRGCFFLSRLVP